MKNKDDVLRLAERKFNIHLVSGTMSELGTLTMKRLTIEAVADLIHLGFDIKDLRVRAEEARGEVIKRVEIVGSEYEISLEFFCVPTKVVGSTIEGINWMLLPPFPRIVFQGFLEAGYKLRSKYFVDPAKDIADHYAEVVLADSNSNRHCFEAYLSFMTDTSAV